VRKAGKTLLALVLCAPALAAQQPARATFYLIAGNDTVTVERVERTPAELRFRMYALKTRNKVDFDGRLLPGGLVESATMTIFATPMDTVPVMRAQARFSGDSVGVQAAAAMNWIRLGPGALPSMSVSGALVEQSLIRARAIGGDSVTIPLMFLPSGPSAPVTIIAQGKDSARIRIGGVTMIASVGADGTFFGATIPSQNARYVRGPATPETVPGQKSYAAPPGAPYTAQDVAIRTPGGLTLRGTLTVPQHAPGARVPAVVTITGSGTQDRDETIPGLKDFRPYYQLADTLGRRGIAVLRLDDRGGGSDGSPASPTPELADDIRAAVAWLRARPEIDPRRIGLVGHSEGGLIAPMVASTDSSIAAVVILAGTSSKGRDIVTAQQLFAVDSMAHLLGQARARALEASARATDSMAKAVPWWTFFLDYDPAPTAARVRAPVLILQGETDRQVPKVEADKLAAAIRGGGNRDVTVRVFPGMNHLFLPDGGVGFSYEKLPSFVVPPAVMGAIADWLSARFTR
jgi:dienelactone hydrolase